jgi:hypothetical protein
MLKIVKSPEKIQHLKKSTLQFQGSENADDLYRSEWYVNFI